jgi:Notch-like protein
MMSPPQSVQSNHTMSPPSHHSSQMMSPPQHQHQQQTLSPAKSAARSIQLPTSPTHMAAMRGATHQKMQSFDFPGNEHNLGIQYANQQQFLYPNPNGVRSDGFHMDGGMSSFMTPSPDSPGQWSSGSPQSHSDWSDGIHSPPATTLNNYHQQQLQHMAQHQLQQTQQTDSVLI